MAAKKITEEHFLKTVGREPVHDELERCNCKLAGEANHIECGWNAQENLPYFVTGRITWVPPEKPNVSKRH